MLRPKDGEYASQGRPDCWTQTDVSGTAPGRNDVLEDGTRVEGAHTQPPTAPRDGELHAA